MTTSFAPGDAIQKGAVFDLAVLPKVDFTGADLEGASLDDAQLQGAFLGRAQLQGASLEGANLKGAYFGDTELQGASLDHAQLQGASFYCAQLQGASLEAAVLEATDLRFAYLWRTSRPNQPSVSAIRMSDESWRPEWKPEEDEKAKEDGPQPWNDMEYDNCGPQSGCFPRAIFATKRWNASKVSTARSPTRRWRPAIPQLRRRPRPRCGETRWRTQPRETERPTLTHLPKH